MFSSYFSRYFIPFSLFPYKLFSLIFLNYFLPIPRLLFTFPIKLFSLFIYLLFQYQQQNKTNFLCAFPLELLAPQYRSLGLLPALTLLYLPEGSTAH